MPRFVVESEKSQIVLSECATIVFSIIYKKGDKIAYHRIENPIDVLPKLKAGFKGFYFESSSSDVKPEKVYYREGEYYLKPGFYKHPVYEISFCPSTIEDIFFPSLKIRYGETHGDIEYCITDPVKVSVTEGDQGDQNISSLVGDFSIKESNLRQGEYKQGEVAEITFELSGYGNLFNLDFEKVETAEVVIEQVSKNFQYQFLSNDLWSQQELVVKITPKKSGRVALDRLIYWEYFSLNENKISRIGSDKIVNFKDVKIRDLGPRKRVTNVIALDISESMKVDGYGSMRIKKGIDLVNRLSVGHPIVLLGFSGEVISLPRNKLDTTVFDLVEKRGTAIGNAILRSIEEFKGAPTSKTLIIIGDGDETAGNISAKYAAELAKEMGIKIYSIGVGHSGRVRFGKDFFGNPRFIEDTYRDDTLKEISRITGGKFFYINEVSNVNEMIDEIFGSDQD